MSHETSKLADTLRAMQARIGLLVCTLQDGTAKTDEQLQVANRLEELADVLKSNTADVNADIVPASRQLLLTERHSA
ncbi:Uncharacterised protein [Amycolatopsis camponoti]|uniref:Uncharacterized protein n=2 Tax=Amycolatopsis camponoti TaxID=2606593 RepID=A0A6I8LWE1_9PSEU|nr:Uncharacterised protein [Amycolatopsis camponoti]